MSSFLHQRAIQNSLRNQYGLSLRSSQDYQKHTSFLFNRTSLVLLLTILVIVGVLFPWAQIPSIGLFQIGSSSKISQSKWREYTLAQAAAHVSRNGTLIVCAVSEPYLPFLNNWLISIARQKQHEKVLVIAEDYGTLYKVNERWPGHAVLVPPVVESQNAHKFGSQVRKMDFCCCCWSCKQSGAVILGLWCLCCPIWLFSYYYSFAVYLI